MSLAPIEKPNENTGSARPMALTTRRDWGRFGDYASEYGMRPGEDRVSGDLTRRVIEWVVGLALAIGIGFMTVRMAGDTANVTWLIFAAGAILGGVLLWRNLEWGIIGYIVIAWMVVGTPDVAQGGSGNGQKIMVSQAGLAALLAVWGIQKILSQKLTLYKNPVNTPILAYLAFAAWSTVNSLLFPNRDVLLHAPKTFLQVNILEYSIRFLALGGVLLLGNVLHGKYLRYAGLILLLPGVATFSGLLSFIPQNNYEAFSQILAMAILAAFTLLDKGPVWLRVISGATSLGIFGLYFIHNTDWVSGWMGALMALAMITFRANKKVLIAAAAVVSIIVVLNFGYFYDDIYTSNFYSTRMRRVDDYLLPWQHFHHGYVRRIFEEQGQLSNDRSRMLYASTLYAEHFPLGIGLGNYRAYNNWFGRPENWDTSTFTSAHGTYAQVISETGWGGFALFAWLLYSNVSLTNKLYIMLKPGRWKTFALGAWGGLIGLYCAAFNGDYIFPAYHNGGLSSFGACVYTHLVIGIMIAVARERGITWETQAPIRVQSKWSSRTAAQGATDSSAVESVSPVIEASQGGPE